MRPALRLIVNEHREVWHMGKTVKELQARIDAFTAPIKATPYDQLTQEQKDCLREALRFRRDVADLVRERDRRESAADTDQ